jgi:hypothetical protein
LLNPLWLLPTSGCFLGNVAVISLAPWLALVRDLNNSKAK